jgi:hypothetical protein
VKVFTVRNGDAIARADMLRGLLGQGSSMTRALRIQADSRMNAVLAVGTAEDLEVIRGVLARLDDPTFYRSPDKPFADLRVQEGLRRTELDKTCNVDVKARPAIPPRRQAEHETQKPLIGDDISDAESQLKAAKAELDRQHELRSKTPAAFLSSKMARAQLAVRCAEIRIEELRAMLTDSRY